MVDWATDSTTGDLDISGKDFRLTVEETGEALAQRLSIRLDFARGEWALDLRQGVPYFEEILVKNPDLIGVRAIFREVILETPGVESIDQLDLDLDTAQRILRVTAVVIQQSNGEPLTFSEEFLIGDE